MRTSCCCPSCWVAFAGFGSPAGELPRSVWPILLFALVVLPHLVPWAALMGRRLHDLGHSGWWALLALIPFTPIFPLRTVLLLAAACFGGAPGPNHFGAAPAGAAVGGPGSAPGGADSAQGAPQAARDPIAEVERLAALRASGSLTETEFEVMKARALRQPRAGA